MRRDPLDARCNNTLGLWHLHRGNFAEAEKCFRKAIERLTRRNSNPYDGEPLYNLGLCLGYLDRDNEAYDSFYKADLELSPGGSELSCAGGDWVPAKNWATALEHLNRSLRFWHGQFTRAKSEGNGLTRTG